MALFVWLGTAQIIAVAHAAEYGDNPHEHQGEVCQITDIRTSDDEFIPSGGFPDLSPIIGPSSVYAPYISQAANLADIDPLSRGPPVRGSNF